MGYSDVYGASKADPDGFWMEAARAIDWDCPPSKALWDENAPLYEWFTDGMVNTCWNAIDRHVEASRSCATGLPHWPAPCAQRASKRATE